MSIPVVFSHASFLTYRGASLLRSTNQHISITPESEMHYGHTHPHSHLIQDQAALGVDTHFTFSTDILTQARLWLQSTRRRLFAQVLDHWHVPTQTPMTANQAFLLATRNGGLALRRPDLGVIAEGAKADLVIWDGESPALLGWVDPVAAVIYPWRATPPVAVRGLPVCAGNAMPIGKLQSRVGYICSPILIFARSRIKGTGDPDAVGSSHQALCSADCLEWVRFHSESCCGNLHSRFAVPHGTRRRHVS